eukprot:m.552483 g.552483  ORF g.552483 m.552483 type:complete len:128 (+) comp22166_c0_seq1:295-678(+)
MTSMLRLGNTETSRLPTHRACNVMGEYQDMIEQLLLQQAENEALRRSLCQRDDKILVQQAKIAAAEAKARKFEVENVTLADLNLTLRTERDAAVRQRMEHQNKDYTGNSRMSLAISESCPPLQKRCC